MILFCLTVRGLPVKKLASLMLLLNAALVIGTIIKMKLFFSCMFTFITVPIADIAI